MTPSAPRPVAFMVMPFHRKPVRNPPEGAPAEVDFDSLWDLAYRPALEQLGYLPVRADSDAGSVIIKDMLERLAFADLVLADMTLPNGNVYYEVGIRHVAKETHCVLISADWSRQLFDVDQMRSLRFPLKDSSVTAETAAPIQQVLIASLDRLKDEKTPFHALITTPADTPSVCHQRPPFPALASSPSRASVFRQQLQEISDFQARLRAVRISDDPAIRRRKVSELIQLAAPSLSIREIAFELLMLVRDNLSWEETLAFIDQLPPAIQDDPFSREQRLLAQSKRGEHDLAIAGLKELARLHGETPERLGMIGGRYKKLWRERRDERIRRGESKPGLRELGSLDDAIAHYRRGAELDLNAYYCLCNLPGLLIIRASGNDLDDSDFFERLTELTCHLRMERGPDDVWTGLALLNAALRRDDGDRVQSLALDLARQGLAGWQLETTLADAEDLLIALPDSERRQRLGHRIEQLRAQLNPS